MAGCANQSRQNPKFGSPVSVIEVHNVRWKDPAAVCARIRLKAVEPIDSSLFVLCYFSVLLWLVLGIRVPFPPTTEPDRRLGLLL